MKAAPVNMNKEQFVNYFISAAAKGDMVAVEKAIGVVRDKKVSLNEIRGRNDLTPLHLAAEHGHVDVVAALLDAGADVNARCLRVDYNNFATRDCTPLHSAAIRGQGAIIEKLIAKGAAIEATAGYGDTPLLLAVKNNHPDAIRALARLGANIARADAVRWAVHSAPFTLIPLLKELGADINSSHLLTAALNDETDAIPVLVKAGALLEGGDTILHRAVLSGECGADAVENLLKYIPDLNIDARDNEGATALHIAAEGGEEFSKDEEEFYADSIKVLLKRGANIEAQSNKGNTPLHSAAYDGRVRAIWALKEGGAKLEARNKKGDTPLITAAQQRRTLAQRALLNYGADVNAKANDGLSALHWAVINEDSFKARLNEFLFYIENTRVIRPQYSDVFIDNVRKILGIDAYNKMGSDTNFLISQECNTLFAKAITKKYSVASGQKDPLEAFIRALQPDFKKGDYKIEEYEVQRFFDTSAIAIFTLLMHGARVEPIPIPSVNVNATPILTLPFNQRLQAYAACYRQLPKLCEFLQAQAQQSTVEDQHGVAPAHRSALYSDSYPYIIRQFLAPYGISAPNNLVEFILGDCTKHFQEAQFQNSLTAIAKPVVQTAALEHPLDIPAPAPVHRALKKVLGEELRSLPEIPHALRQELREKLTVKLLRRDEGKTATETARSAIKEVIAKHQETESRKRQKPAAAEDAEVLADAIDNRGGKFAKGGKKDGTSQSR